MSLPASDEIALNATDVFVLRRLITAALNVNRYGSDDSRTEMKLLASIMADRMGVETTVRQIAEVA